MDLKARFMPLMLPGAYAPSCSWMPLSYRKKMLSFYNKKHPLKHSPEGVTLREALYTTQDVDTTMKLFVGYGYDQWYKIHPDVRIMYNDAGHILGSAGVTLEITENGKTTMIGFTGDIGRPNRPILRDPQSMPECDYLICESTYGDIVHASQPNEMERFLHVIKKTCIEKRGKLIIPAFSVGSYAGNCLHARPGQYRQPIASHQSIRR
jgi:metallo-beta-lactamase family protein